MRVTDYELSNLILRIEQEKSFTPTDSVINLGALRDLVTERMDHSKTIDAAEKAADMIDELRNAVVVATAAIERLESQLTEYRKRLSDASDKAVLRELAIDRNGGSSEGIAVARAEADAYSDALAWAAAIGPLK